MVTAGATTALLAYSTGESARRRADVRLLWVSLTFLVAAGFLGLHALATPGIFRDASNLGFQIATPVGLALAGVLATVSAFPPRDRGIWGTSGFNWPRAALIGLMAAWGIATVAGVAPLDRITKVERASGPMLVLALAGSLLYVVASIRYLQLARERSALLPLAVATGFALLAEALLATSLSRSWHSSWWEWHVLILAAFAIVAWAAQREWREERFAALYTQETAEGSREVSVLFADLAGFTRFAEERDPVEVTRMLNAYFEVAIPPIVREHDGEVDSLIGDAVMATFKSPPDCPTMRCAPRTRRSRCVTEPRTSPTSIPTGPGSGSASTPAMPSSAWSEPAAGAATPSSATPSTSPRGSSRRRRSAGSPSALRPPAACTGRGSRRSASCRSRAAASRSTRSSCTDSRTHDEARPPRVRRRSGICALLAAPAGASADSCDYTGVGTWDTGINWSCGHVPSAGDSATIGSGDAVTLTAPGGVDSLTLDADGQLAFSGGSLLNVPVALTVTSGTLSGDGALTTGPSATVVKSTAGSLAVKNGVDLVLGGATTLGGGNICLSDDSGQDRR